MWTDGPADGWDMFISNQWAMTVSVSSTRTLGKYNNREGIVIDTRFNGGGRLHEDIEILFSGQKYFTQVVRGREPADMPSRRWNKPSIMVTCEANYSNAHGTPSDMSPPEYRQTGGYARSGNHDKRILGASARPVARIRHPRSGLPPARRQLPGEQPTGTGHQVADFAETIVKGEDPN